MISRLVLLIFGVLTLFSLGCGLLFQTAVGWHSQEKVTKSEIKQIEVTSNPPGAQVIGRTPDGVETQLGTAPLNDPVDFQIETTIEHPSVWALVVGSLIEGALAVGVIAATAGSSDDTAKAAAAG